MRRVHLGGRCWKHQVGSGKWSAERSETGKGRQPVNGVLSSQLLMWVIALLQGALGPPIYSFLRVILPQGQRRWGIYFLVSCLSMVADWSRKHLLSSISGLLPMRASLALMGWKKIADIQNWKFWACKDEFWDSWAVYQHFLLYFEALAKWQPPARCLPSRCANLNSQYGSSIFCAQCKYPLHAHYSKCGPGTSRVGLTGRLNADSQGTLQTDWISTWI